VIKKIKKKGIRKSLQLAYWHFINKIKRGYYYFFCLLPVREARIVFESEGDFSDNTRALYDYMKNEDYFSKYQAIWLVDDVEKVKQRENVILVSKKGRKMRIRTAYYLATCGYYFYTHSNWLVNLKQRRKQKIVNLTHGFGYKEAKGSKRTKFDALVVTGDIPAKELSRYNHCTLEKVQKLGYPRNDYFYSDLSEVKEKVEEKYRLKHYESRIIWMPTFRKSFNKAVSEDYFENETGLPIFETKRELKDFDAFLKDKGILLILKVHHLQAELSVFKENYSNILVLRDVELMEMDVQLNQILPLTDGLITDYSSVSTDYMLLDKPIIYTLDDYEQYNASRGIWPPNAIDLMKGEHVYSVEELGKAVLAIDKGEDIYRKERDKLVGQFHENLDGNASKRILKYAGIDKS